MAQSPTGRLTAGDRVGLCLDVDGTVHPHGSIFVETLALVPYASDLAIERSGRDTLRDVLGTHIARPYAGLLGETVDVVGTDFATADGRFTGEYAFVEKGPTVEQLRTERDWDYTVAAGDSATDLPMAAAADLFLAVAGRGAVTDDIPAEFQTVSESTVRTSGLPKNGDAILVERATNLGDALRLTLGALGVDGVGSSDPGEG